MQYETKIKILDSYAEELERLKERADRMLKQNAEKQREETTRPAQMPIAKIKPKKKLMFASPFVRKDKNTDRTIEKLTFLDEELKRSKQFLDEIIRNFNL